MKKLAIIGSGDLAQQIAHHATSDKKYQVIGFYDDFAVEGTLKYGYPILGKLESILEDFSRGLYEEILIGIGYNYMKFRHDLFLQFKGKIPFGKLIHSSVIVDPSAEIREGAIIYPGCIIDMKAKILENSLLNCGCVIAHDSTIGQSNFFGPAVKVAGFVTTLNKVNLGIGTTVIDNVQISSNIKTGASTTITKSLSDEGLYVGTPAKLIKTDLKSFR